MRAILASYETDTCYPLVDKPRVLAGAEMPIMINPAGKDIIVHSSAAPIQPSEQTCPSIRQEFDLNGPPRFLLHHNCSRSHLSASDNVTDLHLHQVTTPKLAVDRQIDQRAIAQAAALVEVKSSFPGLLRLQGRFAPTVFSAFQTGRLVTGTLVFGTYIIVPLWAHRLSAKRLPPRM